MGGSVVGHRLGWVTMLSGHGQARRRVALIAGILVGGPAFAADAPGPEDVDRTQAPAVIAVGEYDVLPAVADAEAAAVDLGRITVTANKREQDQRDVAGSVDVLRGADLEAINAQGMADYLKQVPGVVLLDRGADGAYPVIRGITSSTAELGVITTQLPVGIYIDDMPFNDLYLPLSVPDLHPFDLDRVEVLKGPQGTLFGSGALAGAIRYVTRAPQFGSRETKWHLGMQRDDHSASPSSHIALAQNLPVDDVVALRLVGHYRDSQGLIDEQQRGEDVDRRWQYSGRLQLRWALADELDLSGFVIGQQSVQANFSGSDFPDRFERELGGQSWRESGFSGSNITLRYALEGSDVLSSSNFLTKDAVFDAEEPFGSAPLAEGDGGGVNGPGTEEVGKTDTLVHELYSQTKGWFQEFRWSSADGAGWALGEVARLEWLVGVGYQRTGQDWQLDQEASDVRDLFAPLQQLPLLPLDTPLGPVSGSSDVALIYVEMDSVASEYALFGEVGLRFNPRWVLDLGGRAFKTKLTAKGFMSGSQNIAFDLGSTRTDIDRVVRAEGFNPKLALRYQPRQWLQLHLLAARGFQFGGVQINPTYPTLAQTNPKAFGNYGSSRLWNYEAGLRSEFFHRRVRFDLTLFHLDWRELQISVREPIFPQSDSVGVNITYITNIGRARSRGVEAQLALRPWSWLELNSSGAWMRAETREGFDTALGYVEAGTPLPASPRFQISNRLSLQFAPDGWGGLSLRSNLVHAHVGPSYNDLHRSERQGDYDTLDLHLQLGLSSTGSWALGLGVTNLTDERGLTAVAGARDTREIDYYIVPPRTGMLTVSGRW